MGYRPELKEMTMTNIAQEALSIGEVVLRDLYSMGRASGEAFFLRVGSIDTHGVYADDGTRVVNDGAQFKGYTDPETGKVAAVVAHEENSGEVALRNGKDSDDPRTWTGGVFKKKTIELNDRWYTKKAAGAGSGVQGELDEAVMECVTGVYLGLWALCVKARLEANLPLDGLL